MKSAHIICRNREGVGKASGQDEYTSGSWTLSAAEANALVGGRLYLHETKAEPSYFGGTVLDWAPSKRESGAKEDGITFRLLADQEAKGVAWQGADHAMAWFSGLVE